MPHIERWFFPYQKVRFPARINYSRFFFKHNSLLPTVAVVCLYWFAQKSKVEEYEKRIRPLGYDKEGMELAGLEP